MEAFNARLEGHKWVALPTPTLNKARQQEQAKAAAAAAAGAAVTAEGGGASTGGGESSGTPQEGGTSRGGRAEGGSGGGPPPSHEDLSPPYVIMEHLPLAVLTNAVLSAFNELRHCALMSLSRPAAR